MHPLLLDSVHAYPASVAWAVMVGMATLFVWRARLWWGVGV
jgi:hypothetical protein